MFFCLEGVIGGWGGDFGKSFKEFFVYVEDDMFEKIVFLRKG